jgi:Type VI secretion system VasI, EvfG, VC_A0118
MMWVRLFAIMLCCVGSAVGAQAANETVAGLESCFKLVLRADSMCSNLANDAAQHMDCLEKARTAQLECLQRVPPERSAASVLSPASAKPAATATNLWAISETTSPVDYSPLITAVIRSSSADQDAPKTLAIRCLGRRTELVVRTEGAWRASPAGDIQVAHQINDQPLVRQTWTASADGSTANYKKDSVGFLRSLPEGARLKISVLDASGRGHEATFQLAGLDAARDRIAAPCKWPPLATRTNMSSDQR